MLGLSDPLFQMTTYLKMNNFLFLHKVFFLHLIPQDREGTGIWKKFFEILFGTTPPMSVTVKNSKFSLSLLPRDILMIKNFFTNS